MDVDRKHLQYSEYHCYRPFTSGYSVHLQLPLMYAGNIRTQHFNFNLKKKFVWNVIISFNNQCLTEKISTSRIKAER